MRAYNRRKHAKRSKELIFRSHMEIINSEGTSPNQVSDTRHERGIIGLIRDILKIERTAPVPIHTST